MTRRLVDDIPLVTRQKYCPRDPAFLIQFILLFNPSKLPPLTGSFDLYFYTHTHTHILMDS